LYVPAPFFDQFFTNVWVTHFSICHSFLDIVILPWWMVLVNGLVEWSCWMVLLNGLVEWSCWMVLMNGLVEWSWWMVLMNGLDEWSWWMVLVKCFEWFPNIFGWFPKISFLRKIDQKKSRFFCSRLCFWCNLINLLFHTNNIIVQNNIIFFHTLKNEHSDSAQKFPARAQCTSEV
jgi:hypothetical protein